MTVPTLLIRPSIAARICWGKPNSPKRDLCALCHGPLPEVPLMMWKSDGSGAAFCDDCVDTLFVGGGDNGDSKVDDNG